MKPKKCKQCSQEFIQFKSTRPFCSKKCFDLFNYTKELRENNRKPLKKRTEISEMTRNELIKLAQMLVNKWIKLRDKNEGCISCDTKTSNKWDAGHYWPTTYSFLRFHPDNINKQCSNNCNIHKGGNQLEYRIRLIEKIGESRVRWLDDNRHKELKISNDELRDLIKEYRHKIKNY